MLVDQGSAFRALLMNIAAVPGVVTKRTGREPHSSMGIGERYYQRLSEKPSGRS